MATTQTQHAADHHHHAAGDHTPGTMDIAHHERTFHWFVKAIAWNVVAMAAVLIFLALANA